MNGDQKTAEYHARGKILWLIETHQTRSIDHLRAVLFLNDFIQRLGKERWIKKFTTMDNCLVIWSGLLQLNDENILEIALSTIKMLIPYEQQFRSTSLFHWWHAQNTPFAVFIPGIISCCMSHKNIDLVLDAYRILQQLLDDKRYQRVFYQSGGVEALAAVAILFAENAVSSLLFSVIKTLSNMCLPSSFKVRDEDHHPIQFFQDIHWNMFINHLLRRTVSLKQHGINKKWVQHATKNDQLEASHYYKKEEVVQKHEMLLITCLSAEKAVIEHQYDMNLFTASCLEALQKMDRKGWFDEPTAHADITEGVSAFADFKEEALKMLKRLQDYRDESGLLSSPRL